MPFSYFIAYELIAGIMTYVAINLVTFVIKLVSFGRIVPADKDLKGYWTWKSRDDDQPWFMRAMHGQRRFWDTESRGTTSVAATDKLDDGSIVGEHKAVQGMVMELRTGTATPHA